MAVSKRSAFVATVSKLLDEDDRVVLLLGDISVYAFREAKEKHPGRVLNLGVCEQGSIGFAAGLAMAGFFPIYHTIESFLTRRAFEQLYLDFGIQRLPGLFIGVGGARDYAKLGPTHQSAHGLKLMGEIPGMHVKDPPNTEMLEFWIEGMVRNRELGYIRIEESKTPDLVRSLLEGVDVTSAH